MAERLKLAEAARKFSGCFLKLGYPGLSDCCFSCRGENLREVSTRLVESERLSICIMNIQTFNRGTNRLRAADEYGQVLWEDIRAVRPVVILDEPGADSGVSELPGKLRSIPGLGRIKSPVYPALSVKGGICGKQDFQSDKGSCTAAGSGEDMLFKEPQISGGGGGTG